MRINNGPPLSTNTLLVTMDVQGLFTNIVHKDGMKAMETQLDLREKKEVPTKFIMELMHIILHQNIFEFHDGLWKQNVGAAMGG